ncbi:MAG TPA: hypothetical protein VJH23_05480 [archaeon]|nr:hypothetical protein [archaeon]
MDYSWIGRNADLGISAAIEISAVLAFLSLSFPVTGALAFFILLRLITWSFEYLKFCAFLFSTVNNSSEIQNTFILGLPMVFVGLCWLFNLGIASLFYAVTGKMQNLVEIVSLTPKELHLQLAVGIISGLIFLSLFFIQKRYQSKMDLSILISAILMPFTTLAIILILILPSIFLGPAQITAALFFILIVTDKLALYWFRKKQNHN